LLFAIRWNEDIGIPDLLMIVLMNIIDHFSKAIIFMTMHIIYTRLVPVKAEATIMGMYTSVYYMSLYLLRFVVGDVIKALSKIETELLEKYNLLVVISMIGTILSYVIIIIVPKHK
jgi:hypothetical protein